MYPTLTKQSVQNGQFPPPVQRSASEQPSEPGGSDARARRSVEKGEPAHGARKWIGRTGGYGGVVGTDLRRTLQPTAVLTRQRLLNPAAEDMLLEHLAQEHLHHVGDHSNKQGKDDQPSERRDALFHGSSDDQGR